MSTPIDKTLQSMTTEVPGDRSALFLGAGMTFAVDIQQLAYIDMGVFLSGGQAFMAQELLDDS